MLEVLKDPFVRGFFAFMAVLTLALTSIAVTTELVAAKHRAEFITREYGVEMSTSEAFWLGSDVFMLFQKDKEPEE